jgi:hypothetical protein
MLHAIQLDDQSLREAGEVDDVGVDGSLPSKVVALPPQLAQLSPESRFGNRLMLAEMARCRIGHFPGPSPHP